MYVALILLSKDSDDTEIRVENPLANFRLVSCVYSMLHYKLTRNSHGRYSIVTSPWPRVLAVSPSDRYISLLGHRDEHEGSNVNRKDNKIHK